MTGLMILGGLIGCIIAACQTLGWLLDRLGINLNDEEY